MVRKMVVLSMLMVFISGVTFASAEEVYATKNGKKYHKEICRLIKNKKPEKLDRAEALKKGLEPCHLCYKDESSKVEMKSNQKTTEKKLSQRK